LGRRDHQVKVSGVRVELSEIEGALDASGLLSGVVCIVSSGALVAHVVIAQGEHMDWVVRASLEAAAASRLPQQVVPHCFRTYNALPLAPGGKVDRKALEGSSTSEPIEDGSADDGPFIPLETALEEGVAWSWASAIGREAQSLGGGSNFMWLGGSSLSALRACRLLQTRVVGPWVAAEDEPGNSQLGEAGLMVPAEAPDGALCLLSAIMGPLAPCELLARPTLREYASFLQHEGLSVKAEPTNEYKVSKGSEDSATVTNGESVGSSGTIAELALVAAAQEARIVALKSLLASKTNVEGPARGRLPRGFTPLHAAASTGAVEVIGLLLEARASPRAMTREARTSPAHLAAARGDEASLRALLADRGPSGAATWARDVDEQTVLHLAARSGDVPCVQIALSRVRDVKASGGGMEARDRWGRTALQWAVANGHDAAAVALARAGACTSGLPEGSLPAPRPRGEGPRSRAAQQPLAVRKTLQTPERIAALVEAVPLPDLPATEAQRFALTALRDFCCGAREHREMALASGVASRLVALIGASVADNQDAGTETESNMALGGGESAIAAAAQTCRNLAADRTGASCLCTAGAVPALAGVASRGPGSEAAWRAAAALAQIADWQEHWDHLVGTGAAAILADMAERTGRLHVPEGLLGEASKCPEGQLSTNEVQKDISGPSALLLASPICSENGA